MRRICMLWMAAGLLLPAAGRAATFQVRSADAGPWIRILGSIGIKEDARAEPAIVVAGGGAPADAAELAQSRILILQGASKAAEKFGIVERNAAVTVRQIQDVHAPGTAIYWEKPAEVQSVELPPGFEVFAAEKWKNTPLVAGKRVGRGAVLWLAMDPGASGFERFPYLLQALVDLGLAPTAETMNLWAFFDSAYRSRADSDYLARRWRAAGVSVLQVAAWHNMEPDAERDEYLRKLIEACHRHAILVYAWLELPHVSEKFWADHPEWREKTALGQDAQLDWRKLMNLQNPQCKTEVAREVERLLAKFDWDGVNLAELYFESLEGAANPARFTPLNSDVRAEFQSSAGFDPQQLFEANSQQAAGIHLEALRRFLDYRAQLAARMQGEWLDIVEKARAQKPYLGTVLTHIDDRFEPGIRDELGADIARSLPLIREKKCTLLVEDPATLWALGPERYGKLAEKYRALHADADRLAVDINIVERYQDVYPTKKQTGGELFELLHQAAISFGRVALYFENSLEKQDLGLIPAAASSAEVVAKGPDELEVKAREMTRIAWQGPLEMDGRVWPLQSAVSALIPAGYHRLAAAVERPAITLADFNGDIRTAASSGARLDVSYRSETRAIAVAGSGISRLELDDLPFGKGGPLAAGEAILLPAGEHILSLMR